MTRSLRRTRILLFVLLVVWQPLQAQVCGCRATELSAPVCCCCAPVPETDEHASCRFSSEPQYSSDACTCIGKPIRPEPRRQPEPRLLLLLPPVSITGPVLEATPQLPAGPTERLLRLSGVTTLGPRSPPLS